MNLRSLLLFRLHCKGLDVEVVISLFSDDFAMFVSCFVSDVNDDSEHDNDWDELDDSLHTVVDDEFYTALDDDFDNVDDWGSAISNQAVND